MTNETTPPIFQEIFGESWDDLPSVMKAHYAVRPNSDDVVTVKGTLDIKTSPMVSVVARITGMLLAYSGKNIPVTVVFTNGDDTKSFHFDRTFHFPDRGDVKFRSRMEHIGGNELVEFMRFGIGWKLAYEWDGSKVILRHRGYVWRILGVMIPVPFALALGKGHAEETPLSDSRFAMWTHANHWLLGETFAYNGEFEVTEVSCDQS